VSSYVYLEVMESSSMIARLSISLTVFVMEFQNIIQFNTPIVPKQHFKYVIIELLQLSNSKYQQWTEM
jgi:hypothetical protein